MARSDLGLIVLVVVWYFGGAALLVAGFSLGAAIAFTVGVLAVWRFRSRDVDEYGEPQQPPLPEARALPETTKAALRRL